MAALVTRERCRHILNLPREILLMIANSVDVVHDRLHLMKTCTHFRSLLSKEWTIVSETMDCYPLTYIAVCANKLRENLENDDSSLNSQFFLTLWECTNQQQIVEFCKKHAPATISDLKDLAKIQKDILGPAKKFLYDRESRNQLMIMRIYPWEADKFYTRELYVYWAYCDLFRGDVDAGNSNAHGGTPNQFRVHLRRYFLTILVCPPPEFWRRPFQVHLDKMIQNEGFKISMPPKCPVAWEAGGLSEVITRILLHRGLLTLKIIIANTYLVDENGQVNRTQLSSDVADHVATVVAKASSAEWTNPPTDLIHNNRGSWEVPGQFYWFSLESDLQMLRNPMEGLGSPLILEDDWSGEDYSDGDLQD